MPMLWDMAVLFAIPLRMNNFTHVLYFYIWKRGYVVGILSFFSKNLLI